jgi:UDP-N-acetylmuramyl pentapeptide phosphotransferase/UDP-N-acetylglucosamine-1-phosphate transferase
VLLVAAGAVAARIGLAGLLAATAPPDPVDRPGGSGLPPGGWVPAPGGLEPPGPEARSSTWVRTNYRGRSVSLAGGAALAGAAATTAAAGAPGPAAAAAVLAAGLGAGAAGFYDDLVDGRPEHRAKGFHGHLVALRRGQVTSGVVKLAGIAAAGLVAAAALPPRARPAARLPSVTLASGRGDSAATPGRSWTSRATHRATRQRHSMIDVIVGAGVIAGAANLLNLLDLRPGRALKVGLLVAAPLAAGRAGGLAAGPAGAAAALLPEDLAEQTMLGDCGANALGAVLGAALVAGTGRVGRGFALAVIAGLTAASERVSFTQVIARTPGLRELDQLGRARPADPDPGSPRR